MKALVVYDSQYGNTKQIAVAIAGALGPEVQARPVDDVEGEDLGGFDLLVVGSPTQGGRPTKPTQALLKGIPARALSQTRVAAFDTRIPAEHHGFLLRGLMRLIGYAAPKIDAALRARGGTPGCKPRGFFVEGAEGPLRSGEIDEAKAWALSLSRNESSAAV